MGNLILNHLCLVEISIHFQSNTKAKKNVPRRMCYGFLAHDYRNNQVNSWYGSLSRSISNQYVLYLTLKSECVKYVRNFFRLPLFEMKEYFFRIFNFLFFLGSLNIFQKTIRLKIIGAYALNKKKKILFWYYQSILNTKKKWKT